MFSRMLEQHLQVHYPGSAGAEDFRRRLAMAGCEISRSTLYAWRSGSRSPGVRNLHAVLDVLEVPAQDRGRWLSAAAED